MPGPPADPVLAERVARHGFGSRPARSAIDAAALVCGIQAQDAGASRLGVRARATGVTETDVLACIADRRVVRTWLMRNTIHLVPARDVRWLTALLGPMIRRRFETARWPQLGLTPELLAAATGAAPAVLRGRSLTRREFADALAGHGVSVDPAGQAPTHVLLHLSTIGLVCRGVDRGRDASFTLLDEWLPGSPEGPRGDDALAELARRYFAAFSPATPADFTAWSGLPAARAIDLIRDELRPCEVHGRAGFRLGDVEPVLGLRLLPAFDNYLLGYRHRPFIDEARRAEVYVGGVIRPTVLIDGRVAGRWQLARARGGAVLTVHAFAPFSRHIRSELDAEAADLGRFVDLPVDVRLA